ncbi:uncharacterized protein B0H18DRAFT_990264 [Fomitopsis serialis]|uniref:uncharacterized protein n=1 Tax=Fomitopsis serialis TaxID=139415 RepID=UPI0020074B50|nr:uncharacterized protein B0H18DRAFT_990264 [Neoantrodia serialis]KAH9931215.1 hypothetical protein B0H18DRAFT_990264 [Neoantrodia serialis]
MRSAKFVFKNQNIKDPCGCGESFSVGSCAARVHLPSDDGEERLAVDEDADVHAVLLDHLVELAGLVEVLEVVREPCAALVPHAYLYELGRTAHRWSRTGRD